MIEILYLGIGIVGLLVLNTAYMGWRGSKLRKADGERNNPFSGR